MKTFILLGSLALSGCGLFSTGVGTFNGRVVDVEWGGILFKSCEVRFQLGEQSSSVSQGSSRDKALCNELASKIGEVVTVRYSTLVRPCCVTMDTQYEIFK